MKKYSFLFSFITILIAGLISCDEDGQIDADTIHTQVSEPIIESFEPTSGVPGTEILLTGSSLSSVDTVYIGGVQASIKNRITDTSLLIEVTADAKSGKIKIRNPHGTTESAGSFQVQSVKPEITEIHTIEARELVLGETVTVKGNNLKSVTGIEVGGLEALLIYTTEKELQFKVPFINGITTAQVTFFYQDGEESGSIIWDEEYTLVASGLVPQVTEAPTTALIGEQISLKGTNLDLANSAILGSIAVNFDSKTSSEIKLTIPTSFSTETVVDLILIFNSTEQTVVVNNFTITVPPISSEVLFWPDITLGAEKSELPPFFDPESGNIYTPCDYQSVKNKIYIYPLSFSSGNTIQLNNPANNTTQAPRFECDGTALPAEAMPNVVKYRVLKPSTARENAYIEMVKNKTLGKISPEIIAEAGISDASTSTPRYNDAFVIGDVIMFQKFDATGVTVEKVGFIEITEVNLASTLSQSTITFNCFFQK